MRLLLAYCMCLASCPASAETRINLPGSIFGGVEICNVFGCKSTPGDRETPARILSYHPDTGTIVEIKGNRFLVPGNQVGLKYRGCQMTLKAYLARSYCSTRPTKASRAN